MPATISQAWAHNVDSNPNGSVTIGGGSNRALLGYLSAEHGAGTPVPVITVGGQAETIEYIFETEDGADDMYVFMFLWNEAAVAAMSGSTISWSSGQSLTKRGWGFATYQDVDQSSFPKGQAELASTSGGTTIDIGSTSVSGDRIIVASMNKGGIAHSAWDTLAESQDANVDSGNAQVGLGEGNGGDGTTTVTYASSVNHAVMAIVLGQIGGNVAPLAGHHLKQMQGN